MFVIGVTRATGKLLVTSLFKGVGTLEDAEPRRVRNSTREVQQGYKNRWEFQLEWSSFGCGPVMRLLFKSSVKTSDSKGWQFWTAEWMSNFRIGTSVQAGEKFSWEQIQISMIFCSSRPSPSHPKETVSCWASEFSKTL
jgi:hypothetical protein